MTQARDAGLLVIALDTPLDPIDAADATFATDNFLAGELIGQWAAAQLGDDAANAKIAMLDLAVSQPTVGVLRDQGFLQGFGIDLGDPNMWGDEDDARIVGNDVTAGNEEGGRTAMENLLAVDADINVVYTINEPAAAGAYEALRSIGREDDVLIVSVDGGCPGVQNIAEGVIGATSMQFPLLMASLGIDAIKAWAETGEKPQNTEGLDFYNTGVELITDEPVEGMRDPLAIVRVGAGHGNRGGQVGGDFLGKRRSRDDGQRPLVSKQGLCRFVQEAARARLQALAGPGNALAFFQPGPNLLDQSGKGM